VAQDQVTNLMRLLRTSHWYATQWEFPSDKLMTVHQIHSAEVIISSDQVIGTNPKADAIVSNTKGMAIGILTADCAPILFCDQATGIVGAAHSGWQGALKGIAQNTVKEMVDSGCRYIKHSGSSGPVYKPKKL
jgi:copper oxidase (laccase) domain-containing protein